MSWWLGPIIALGVYIALHVAWIANSWLALGGMILVFWWLTLREEE